MAQDKQPRMLAVDNELVVPVNKVVRVQVTGADVIHSFGVPAFGIKIDAIPGRLNETWFKATKTGMFYGQCSELCGRDHAFMPIAVRVVSDQDFAAWVETAKKKFASLPGNDLRLGRRRRRTRPQGATRIDGTRATGPARVRRIQGTARQDLKMATTAAQLTTITTMTIMRTTIRPGGGASSIRPITRTSARCTWCSPSSRGSSAA